MSKKKEHPYVELARATIREYTLTGRRKGWPDSRPAIFNQQAGVFVSIKKGGKLRGCIGTIRPTRENLAAEISHNAISAASQDPRFEPIGPDELPELEISVDVLGPAEVIQGSEELDPFKYGVIVEKGERRGLLLPNLEGVDTVEKQVAIAREKAGISPGEEVKIYRFQVDRFK